MKYKLGYLSMLWGLISMAILNEELKQPENTPLVIGTMLLSICGFAVMTLWLLKKRKELSNPRQSIQT